MDAFGLNFVRTLEGGSDSKSVSRSTTCRLVSHITCLTVQMPDRFDPAVVLNQLRYSGMLETVKIRRAGFPVRRPFQEFCCRWVVLGSRASRLYRSDQRPTFVWSFCRYKVLMRNELTSNDARERCVELLQRYDDSATDWQMGKTKVSRIGFFYVQ